MQGNMIVNIENSINIDKDDLQDPPQAAHLRRTNCQNKPNVKISIVPNNSSQSEQLIILIKFAKPLLKSKHPNFLLLTNEHFSTEQFNIYEHFVGYR